MNFVRIKDSFTVTVDYIDFSQTKVIGTRFVGDLGMD